jgi:AraC-like DNA-binding protein
MVLPGECHDQVTIEVVRMYDNPFSLSTLTISIFSIKPFAMQVQLTDADVQRLALVRETILKNLRYHYTIPTLAQTAGINEFKLKTGFKALYGQPVFDFLTEQRMKMAMELMESNNYSIGEIAHRCGYNHPTNFCAAFRRRYHIRPSDYRRNATDAIRSAI